MKTKGLESRANSLFRTAVDEARREGYEQARAHAETALYGGTRELFAWVGARPEGEAVEDDGE